MQSTLYALLLSGLGRDALKLAAGLVLALVIALAFTISSLAALFGAAAPGAAIASARLDDIPADQLAVMRAAAATCGLPWQALAAVAKVESGFGQAMAASASGASGYGKLPASSWAIYGNHGNPFDYRDALPAMARDLCAHGATRDLRGALAAVDSTSGSADQIVAVAVRYGYLAPGTESTRVVDLARAQIGMPYVWGGASPATSFDCSGLVQWTYSQLGVGLPRTAQEQFDATRRISPGDLQPGDLLFFANTYSPSPDVITHVGIYVGDGQMINAPNEGDVVREMPAFTGFWGAHYAGAGRVGG